MLDMYGKILKKTKLFKLNFSDEFINNLSLYLKEKRIGPEELIYNENTDPKKMYFLMSGNVNMFINVKSNS